MNIAETIRSTMRVPPAKIPPAPDTGHSGVLGLLSSMYLCTPSRETLAAWSSVIRDGDADVDELRRVLGGIDTDSAETLEDLRWDYTRLFIGPYKLPCPPWESVYRSQARLLMQDAADDVRRFYAAVGLSMEDTGVMPDHVGVELHFLALLSEIAESIDGPQSEIARLKQAFLNDHLLQWIPQFAADMEAAAESDFYRTLARVTRDALTRLSKTGGAAPI